MLDIANHSLSNGEINECIVETEKKLKSDAANTPDKDDIVKDKLSAAIALLVNNQDDLLKFNKTVTMPTPTPQAPPHK